MKNGILSNMDIIKWLDVFYYLFQVENQQRVYRDGTTLLPVNNTATLTNVLSNTLNTKTLTPFTNKLNNSIKIHTMNETKVSESQEKTYNNISIKSLLMNDLNYSTEIVTKSLQDAMNNLDDDLIDLEDIFNKYSSGDDMLPSKALDMVVDQMGYNIASPLY